jgi:predicted nucleic acid-binding protein
VSSLITNDANHAASLQWLVDSAHAGQTLFVPSLFVAEVANAVARRTTVKRLGTLAVQGILSNRAVQLVAIDESLASHAATVAAAHSLRGADAVYVALADRLDIPLVTLDREQIDRASSIIQVTQPI